MIAAFDANVLASASIRSAPAAPPVAIWDIWLTDKPFTLVLTQHVLTEVERTLRKPYFTARLSPGEIATFLDRLRSQALMAPIAVQVTGVATHAEDDLILAGAVSANAGYLVTGDLKLIMETLRLEKEAVGKDCTYHPRFAHVEMPPGPSGSPLRGSRNASCQLLRSAAVNSDFE